MFCVVLGIRLAKITTKPRFDKAKFKVYHETIPKAVKIKECPSENNTKATELEKMLRNRRLVVNFEKVMRMFFIEKSYPNHLCDFRSVYSVPVMSPASMFLCQDFFVTFIA